MFLILFYRCLYHLQNRANVICKFQLHFEVFFFNPKFFRNEKIVEGICNVPIDDEEQIPPAKKPPNPAKSTNSLIPDIKVEQVLLDLIKDKETQKVSNDVISISARIKELGDLGI